MGYIAPIVILLLTLTWFARKFAPHGRVTDDDVRAAKHLALTDSGRFVSEWERSWPSEFEGDDAGTEDDGEGSEMEVDGVLRRVTRKGRQVSSVHSVAFRQLLCDGASVAALLRGGAVERLVHFATTNSNFNPHRSAFAMRFLLKLLLKREEKGLGEGPHPYAATFIPRLFELTFERAPSQSTVEILAFITILAAHGSRLKLTQDDVICFGEAMERFGDTPIVSRFISLEQLGIGGSDDVSRRLYMRVFADIFAHSQIPTEMEPLLIDTTIQELEAVTSNFNPVYSGVIVSLLIPVLEIREPGKKVKLRLASLFTALIEMFADSEINVGSSLFPGILSNCVHLMASDQEQKDNGFVSALLNHGFFTPAVKLTRHILDVDTQYDGILVSFFSCLQSSMDIKVCWKSFKAERRVLSAITKLVDDRNHVSSPGMDAIRDFNLYCRYLEDAKKNRQCESCEKVDPSKKFKKCGAEMCLAYYCGKECQVADWKAGHKGRCGPQHLSEHAAVLSGAQTFALLQRGRIQEQLVASGLRLGVDSFLFVSVFDSDGSEPLCKVLDLARLEYCLGGNQKHIQRCRQVMEGLLDSEFLYVVRIRSNVVDAFGFAIEE
ncbi:hypothetical protein BC830DRAFT_1163792 [Chytriomyces sp. MP71]|nr:hypothetical protein BC830DRAFT_1163792 [Chytriomyces sp. MP71]